MFTASLLMSMCLFSEPMNGCSLPAVWGWEGDGGQGGEGGEGHGWSDNLPRLEFRGIYGGLEGGGQAA